MGLSGVEAWSVVVPNGVVVVSSQVSFTVKPTAAESGEPRQTASLAAAIVMVVVRKPRAASSASKAETGRSVVVMMFWQGEMMMPWMEDMVAVVLGGG